jgi:hypothetical protein
MKKLALLSALLLAFFAFTSCGDDDEMIDYSESTLTFTLGATEPITWVGHKGCYAALSGTTLTLQATSATGGETLIITVTDVDGNDGTGTYENKTLGGRAFGFTYTGTATVEITYFPDEINDFVVGSFSGTVTHVGETKAIIGSFSLVRKQ